MTIVNLFWDSLNDSCLHCFAAERSRSGKANVLVKDLRAVSTPLTLLPSY